MFVKVVFSEHFLYCVSLINGIFGRQKKRKTQTNFKTTYICPQINTNIKWHMTKWLQNLLLLGLLKYGTILGFTP